MNAYDRIKRLLLEPTFLPGEHLKVGELVRRCNAGQASVREALLILASERLVELRPHKGFFTTTPNPKEIRGLYILIKYISIQAVAEADQAIARVIESDDARLRPVITTGMPDETEKDLHARSTNAFFEAIARLSQSPVVVESVQRANFRLHHVRRAEPDVLDDAKGELQRITGFYNSRAFGDLARATDEYHTRRLAQANTILKAAYGSAGLRRI